MFEVFHCLFLPSFYNNNTCIRQSCWNVGRIFIHFSNIWHIKSNCWIVFLKVFPVMFSWLEIYSFPVSFTYKRPNFWYSLRFFSFCSWFNVTVVVYWSYLSSSLIGVIVSFLFLSNQENLYIIHNTSNSFCDICNAKN